VLVGGRDIGQSWVAGWVFGQFRWGFDFRWVGVGCGVAHSGFVVWLAMGFWSTLVVLGGGLYCLFITNKNN
jgi:hypothetical protein